MIKHLLLSIIFLHTFFSCSNQFIENQSICNYIDFKYYQGNEFYLGELSNDFLLIGCDSSYSNNQIENYIEELNFLDTEYTIKVHQYQNYKFKEIIIKLESSKSCEEMTPIISQLNGSSIISYVNYTTQTDYCFGDTQEQIGDLCVNTYSSLFYVKVLDANDLADLNLIVNETNTEVVEQNSFMDEWFTLSATKNSTGDAIAMANYFFETQLFEKSEPDLTKYAIE